jgi:hypothetical protein
MKKWDGSGYPGHGIYRPGPIETAKADGWNPAKYLTRIFGKAAVMKPSDDGDNSSPGTSSPKFFQGVVQIDG